MTSLQTQASFWTNQYLLERTILTQERSRVAHQTSGLPKICIPMFDRSLVLASVPKPSPLGAPNSITLL